MSDHEWATVVAGIVGLCLLWWRSRSANRHAETDSKRLIQERFQKGAELMGNLFMNVRWAGVVVLADLARDEGEEYKEKVLEFFLAYMSYPVKYPPQHEKAGQIDYESRETVEVVRRLIEWKVQWVDQTLAGRHIIKTIEKNEELQELHAKLYTHSDELARTWAKQKPPFGH